MVALYLILIKMVLMMRKINALLFRCGKIRGCPIPDTDKDGVNDEETNA